LSQQAAAPRRPAWLAAQPFSATLTCIRKHRCGNDGEAGVALKIELKPNERVILGDCVVTNAGPRTRLTIEGHVPILREKDVMAAGRANSPARRVYLAIQRMYTSKRSEEHQQIYAQLVRELLKAAPGTRPFIESINNRILTGELYKALKETRKLIAYEEESLAMNYASQAYAKTAKETVPPRELEASLLLKAAAQLQAVQDSWQDKPPAMNNALLYNRRLWTVFLDSVTSEESKLPAKVRDNLTKLGMFVMGETFALMTKPRPQHLASIIKINRGIAAGLRGKA
jgi:flagellar biosynthesis repressor protein FlbT